MATPITGNVGYAPMTLPSKKKDRLATVSPSNDYFGPINRPS